MGKVAKSHGHPRRGVGFTGDKLEHVVQVERTVLAKAWRGPWVKVKMNCAWGLETSPEIIA